MPRDPDLPISQLKPDSPIGETVKRYAATVETLKGAIKERDALLRGCMR